MYIAPSIEIVTISIEGIVCQSDDSTQGDGSTRIDNYNEDNLDW